MEIRDDTWDVFKLYLEQAIDYFESFEDMDFETETLRDQLASILNHDPLDQEEGK